MLTHGCQALFSIIWVNIPPGQFARPSAGARQPMAPWRTSTGDRLGEPRRPFSHNLVKQ